MGGGVPVRVSVVVPVHNTLRYLPEALGSLEHQGFSPGELEVVVVDDGSTDGSGEWLDAWAAFHPSVRVLHQENSGWPGQPRNRGVDASVGEYVFFLDSDDYLAPDALRRMYEYAAAHRSDVVVPRNRGINGRRASSAPFGVGRTEDADLRHVMLTLRPHKLFRRAFLLEHGLRFPEGKVRLEDGLFITRAYLLAARVSSLADDVYYYLRQRETGDNISGQRLDPAGYSGSIGAILQSIRELCKDAALADDLVLLVYRRKGLKVFRGDRFLRYSPVKQAAWVAAVRGLAVEYVPVRLERTLPEPDRTISALTRAGDVAGQRRLALGHADGGPVVPAPLARRVFNRLGVTAPGAGDEPGARLQVRLDRVLTRRTGVTVKGAARLRGAPPAHLRFVLVVSPRRSPEERALEVPVRTSRLDAQGWQSWRAVLASEQLASLKSGRYRLTLRSARGQLQHRLRGAGDVLRGRRRLRVAHRSAVVPYVTARSTLGLRVVRRPRRSSTPAASS